MFDVKKLAKELLNAVWNEDYERVEDLMQLGADPNWVFNGFPILLHAVVVRNADVVSLLIDYGAVDKEEALGFALENGIGEVIGVLVKGNTIPRHFESKKGFGDIPSRYCPLGHERKAKVTAA